MSGQFFPLSGSLGKMDDLTMFRQTVLSGKTDDLVFGQFFRESREKYSVNNLQLVRQGEERILFLFFIKIKIITSSLYPCHMPETGNQQTQPG